MKPTKALKKWHRKIQLGLLARTSADRLLRLGEKKLLRSFRKSGKATPALAHLLNLHRINSKSIDSIAAFSALNFTMNKENSFNQYSMAELCRPGVMENLHSLLTSSGHSGNFAFGLTTWQQAKKTPDLIDLALESAFQIDEKKTLLVNCLPMGVRFPTNSVTQAEVSVREDMALALITKFAPFYDQVIIACDPLFLKLLLDGARDRKVDWRAIHTHLIIGEETFGENFRDYVGRQLGIDPDVPATGLVGSSLGVGELGLNLGFETSETIALRRQIRRSPALMRRLFGCETEKDALPMLFAYNPLSYYLEIHHQDDYGFGDLHVSILDADCPLPLYRYQTGDEGRLLTSEVIRAAFHHHGQPTPDLPNLPLVAIRGRDKDRLDHSGLHIGAVKDALYQDAAFADHITGAFRIDKADPTVIHIQLRTGVDQSGLETPDICARSRILFPASQVRLWDHAAFPYGKTIDYERKFTYLA